MDKYHLGIDDAEGVAMGAGGGEARHNISRERVDYNPLTIDSTVGPKGGLGGSREPVF